MRVCLNETFGVSERVIALLVVLSLCRSIFIPTHTLTHVYMQVK